MKNKIIGLILLIAVYLSIVGRIDARFWEVLVVGLVWIFWKDIKEIIKEK